MLYESESLTCLNQAADQYYHGMEAAANPFLNLNLKHLFQQHSPLLGTTATGLHTSSSSNHSSGHSAGLALPEKISRTNLYIKGLGEDFTDDRLWELVPERDQVKSVKAATEEDSKCRGYGFIDFVSGENAQAALRHIQLNYPQYTIKFAKENEKDRTNLYVTNIPKAWTTKDCDKLKEVFEKFGHIQSAFVMVEKCSSKASAGVGFVRFTNESEALHTIDSLKNSPLILAGCDAPVEAKFADKHNPETRRRKHQTSTTTLTGTQQLFSNPLLTNALGFNASGLAAFGGMTAGALAASSTGAGGLLQATLAAHQSNDPMAALFRGAGGATVPQTATAYSPVCSSTPGNAASDISSLIAAPTFTANNYYGLCNNQYLRGGPAGQNPGAANPILTDAVVAALTNGMKAANGNTATGQSSAYSLHAAYQSLLQGTTSSASNPHQTACYPGSVAAMAKSFYAGTTAASPVAGTNPTLGYQNLPGTATPASLNGEALLYYQ